MRILHLHIFIILATVCSLFSQVAFAQQSPSNVKDSLLQVAKQKRITDSIARVELKMRNMAVKDSLIAARNFKRQADSLVRVADKLKIMQERKTADSIKKLAIQRTKDSLNLDRKRIEFERQEQKRIQDEARMAQKQKLDSALLARKNNIDNPLLLASEGKGSKKPKEEDKGKTEEKKNKNLEKIRQKQIDDSLSLIQKAIKDSIQLVKKEEKKLKEIQEQEIRNLAKLQRQQEKAYKDSLENVLREEKLAQEIEAKKAAELIKQQKEAEQKVKDSIDNVKRQEEIAKDMEEKRLADLVKQQKQAEQKIKDSLDNVKRQEQIAKDMEEKRMADLVKQAEQKAKDSILQEEKKSAKLLQQEQEKLTEVDTNKINRPETNLNTPVNDSLSEEQKRIRLQAIKYEKQRIEDSLLAEANKPSIKVDTINTEKIKVDSLAQINLKKAQEDSIFMAKIYQQEKKTYYAEKDKIIQHHEQKQDKYTYLGFSYGLSNYLGDLGGNSGLGKKFLYDNNFKKSTFFVGVSLSYLHKNAFGFRLAYTQGKIAGSDHDTEFENRLDNAYFRYKRNLNFQSKITEFSINAELYPLRLLSKESFLHKADLQPYGMFGAGIFHFNPQGTYYDDIAEDYIWVNLQPLRTEGQGMKEYADRKPYKLTQWNLPFGFGLNYALGNKTNLSFEFIGRKLFTDYLDDVSTTFIEPSTFNSYLSDEDAEIAKLIYNKSGEIDPDNPFKVGEKRGNAQNNDFYYSFNLKLSIRLNKKAKAPVFKKTYKFDDTEICD